MSRYVFMLAVALALGLASADTTRAQEAVAATAPALQDATLPPLLDRNLFFGDPEISGGSLSPDGSMIAFRKPLNGVMNVFVKGIDEPFE
ncbi:MAG: S9 family peptidase, partial [Bacteroidota bacterium]